MTTWFTSDLHLSHKNIIKYCNRPFETVEEMDETLINNWNQCVGPKDTIYCLGDFTFGKHKPYLQRLNGKKHLIKGNHDKRPSTFDGWKSVDDLLEVKINKQRIILCHYALRTWNAAHHSSWHLYGHSHGTLPDDPKSQSIDVGVDCHEFRPISYEEVEAIMNNKDWVSPFK